MGPGFFFFFRKEKGSSGGYYKKKYKTLKSLKDYEDSIKKILDKEKEELLKEEKEVKELLARIEAKQLKDEKKDKIRLDLEYELQLSVISESLLQIERDLAEINRKRANIKLMARIMRDDEEAIALWVT